MRTLILTSSFIILFILYFGFIVSSTEDTKKTTATTTSGGTLDIKLESIPNPIKNNQEAKFKVSFLKKGTEIVQQHIDYNFIILKNNKEIFNAAKQTEQPLLHTAEGVITIPFTFHDAGNYIIKITVMGINFIPISAEYAEIPIKVG